MTKASQDEPEEAFPYLPPTDELRAEYADIFALTDPIQPRADKWVFDKVIALAVLTVAAPLLALMWCAYKIEGLIDHSSRGPAFYYYWSISGGKKIKKRKVRAVKVQYIDPELARQHDWRASKGEWNASYRTRVGHFAKSYYLDELPQFWSVLKGDMSIVGPRPLAIHHYERDLAQGNVARSIIRGGILGFGHIRKGHVRNGRSPVRVRIHPRIHAARAIWHHRARCVDPVEGPESGARGEGVVRNALAQ